LKDEFSVKFSPFLTQITIYQTAQGYCTRTLSDLFQCYAVIFDLQIAATSSSSSGSGSQNMKNQRTVSVLVFSLGEKEPESKNRQSVEVISEASKNQQLS
jgi:hypothetical protein